MQINLVPSNENAFGVALLAGRVVGTVQGSTGHITIRATCKAKSQGGRWNTVSFADATHVFFDVPSAESDWADKVGVFYPPHSGLKWAGHWFDDQNQTDPKRIAAAKYLIATIAGDNDGKHVLKSERCARCSKELTHPDSIFAMFGPECIKKVSAFMPNRSGTTEGAHEAKSRGTIPMDVEPVDEVLSDFSDDELDRVIAKNVERTREPGDDNDRRAQRAIIERGRRNRERDEKNGTSPRRTREDHETTSVEAAARFEDRHGREDDTPPNLNAWAARRRVEDFVPPSPDFSRTPITLRKGDNLKEVLKSTEGEA